MKTPTLAIRPATQADVPDIRALMALSARELTKDDYPAEAIESALQCGAWGIDSQLIRDETYYLVFVEKVLAACGGWSFRQTLHGSDAKPSPDDTVLDPAVDAARIRAFFVHPCFARRGLGALLLSCCENAARIAGFRAFELAATAGGERLYRANGYCAVQPIDYDVGNSLTMRGLLMRKRLGRRPTPHSRRKPQITTGDTTLVATSAP